MKKIIVIGSVNIDNVIYTKVMPSGGITTEGESFLSNIGGKGANQACAAFFLGADVRYYGAIGKDDNGKRIKNFLADIGMEEHLMELDTSTGVASITLDINTGENYILCVPGANKMISKEDIRSIEDKIKACDILLIQLETPMEAVLEALKIAKANGLTTILNPAPCNKLPEEIYQYCDFFIPNEHELDTYVEHRFDTYEEKAKYMLSKGLKHVIVTLGSKGSLYVSKEKVVHIAPHKVHAVDTTGAGDSYLGAFATALAEGKEIEEGMNFASKCSSITVTKKGAISSLPHKEDL